MFFSDNWSCHPNELRCGIGTPVCISPHVICDGVDDCSDGKDEESQLCGKFLEEADFILFYFGDIISSSYTMPATYLYISKLISLKTYSDYCAK